MKNMQKIPLSTDDIIHRKNLENIIRDGRFRVAIFGSARINPEDECYVSVSELARNLALK